MGIKQNKKCIMFLQSSLTYFRYMLIYKIWNLRPVSGRRAGIAKCAAVGKGLGVIECEIMSVGLMFRAVKLRLQYIKNLSSPLKETVDRLDHLVTEVGQARQEHRDSEDQLENAAREDLLVLAVQLDFLELR